MAEPQESRPTCTREHRIPSIGKILTAFSLEDRHVLNIYVVGSHLWGTCRSSSDWDLIIVVSELLSVKPLNHHKGHLEAFVLSKEQYLEQVTKHSLHLLITLWLPKVLVIREKFDPMINFHLSPESLASTLLQDKERDFRVARKHFIKGDRDKAKLILVHSIRYLDLGIQIKNSSQVSNYMSANQYRGPFLGNYSEEWCELLEEVGPVFDRLWTTFVS